MATLEELEQRVADLEQYVEEQATHTLAYSAEQIDAFFATLDARVLSAGSKEVEVSTNNRRYADVTLTAEDLGVTNITQDIKILFAVHALDVEVIDEYHFAFATSVSSNSHSGLRLRFCEAMSNPNTTNVMYLRRGTYRVNWLRIG